MPFACGPFSFATAAALFATTALLPSCVTAAAIPQIPSSPHAPEVVLVYSLGCGGGDIALGPPSPTTSVNGTTFAYWAAGCDFNSGVAPHLRLSLNATANDYGDGTSSSGPHEWTVAIVVLVVESHFGAGGGVEVTGPTQHAALAGPLLPTADWSALWGAAPLNVTISNNTFAAGAVIRFVGALPPHSSLLIAGNTFTEFQLVGSGAFAAGNIYSATSSPFLYIHALIIVTPHSSDGGHWALVDGTTATVSGNSATATSVVWGPRHADELSDGGVGLVLAAVSAGTDSSEGNVSLSGDAALSLSGNTLRIAGANNTITSGGTRFSFVAGAGFFLRDHLENCGAAALAIFASGAVKVLITHNSATLDNSTITSTHWGERVFGIFGVSIFGCARSSQGASIFIGSSIAAIRDTIADNIRIIAYGCFWDSPANNFSDTASISFDSNHAGSHNNSAPDLILWGVIWHSSTTTADGGASISANNNTATDNASVGSVAIVGFYWVVLIVISSSDTASIIVTSNTATSHNSLGEDTRIFGFVWITNTVAIRDSVSIAFNGNGATGVHNTAATDTAGFYWDLTVLRANGSASITANGNSAAVTVNVSVSANDILGVVGIVVHSTALSLAGTARLYVVSNTAALSVPTKEAAVKIAADVRGALLRVTPDQGRVSGLSVAAGAQMAARGNSASFTALADVDFSAVAVSAFSLSVACGLGEWDCFVALWLDPFPTPCSSPPTVALVASGNKALVTVGCGGEASSVVPMREAPSAVSLAFTNVSNVTFGRGAVVSVGGNTLSVCAAVISNGSVPAAVRWSVVGDFTVAALGPVVDARGNTVVIHGPGDPQTVGFFFNISHGISSPYYAYCFPIVASLSLGGGSDKAVLVTISRDGSSSTAEGAIEGPSERQLWAVWRVNASFLTSGGEFGPGDFCTAGDDDAFSGLGCMRNALFTRTTSATASLSVLTPSTLSMPCSLTASASVTSFATATPHPITDSRVSAVSATHQLPLMPSRAMNATATWTTPSPTLLYAQVSRSEASTHTYSLTPVPADAATVTATASRAEQQIVTLRPIPAERRSELAAEVTGTGVGAIAVVAAFTPLPSMGLAVANAWGRLVACGDEDADHLPFLVHPLQFSFGRGESGLYFGAALGNGLLIPAAVAFVNFVVAPWVYIAVRRWRDGRKEVDIAQARRAVGWPAVLVVPFVT